MNPRVLFATSELTPIAKVGGLGDVAGALPPAVAKLGVDIRVVLPRYEPIDTAKYPMRPVATDVPVRFGAVDETVNVYEGTVPGSRVPIYFVENARYLSTHGIYFEKSALVGTFAEIERFLFFTRSIPAVLAAVGFTPTVVHAQDWHTGFLPWALDRAGLRTPTLYTIHNLANQGRWNPRDVTAFLGATRDELPERDGGGDANAMLSGIRRATRVSTVSPTYAREILTPEFGEGLEGALAERAADLSGILNGIDTARFDPATDPDLPANYTRADLRGKAACKAALQRELGLEPRPDAPLLGLVSRLTNQKGVELVAAVGPVLAELDAQLVVLGTGTPAEEAMVRTLAERYPERVRATIGFDAGLAQRIYAGSDLFLMPSRFEPCGLGQMIAMRYGSVPVVRATGGLADTVPDATADPNRGLGFAFGPYDATAFLRTVRTAVEAFRDGTHWRALVERGMAQDLSWERSAGAYRDLYRTLSA